MWPHTLGAVGRHLLGFGAFLKGTSVMVMKVERVLYIHFPHLQSLLDLNPQPLITSPTL